MVTEVSRFHRTLFRMVSANNAGKVSDYSLALSFMIRILLMCKVDL